MPSKPPSYLRCLREERNLTKRSPLESRHRLANPKQRELARLRNSTRWRKVRAHVLRRQPLCVHCRAQGRLSAATQVDHVVPLALRRDLAFAVDNLQGLCVLCHAKKSTCERRAARPRRPQAGGVVTTSTSGGP